MRTKFNAALGQALAVCLLLGPASWAGVKYRVLHNFGSGNDGSMPAGTLVRGSNGSLYGATSGGDSGCKGTGSGGTLFRLTSHGAVWRERILYCFAGQYIDGFPDGGLIEDGSGNLFGTAAGGPGGVGDVFELMPSGESWNFSTIYAYHGGGCLVPDQAGDLYGCIGPGEIGELSPSSQGWTYTDLWDGSCGDGSERVGAVSPLTCPDGSVLVAPPTWDAGGNLYGTTLYGGNYPPECGGSAGCGVAFRMTPNGDGTWTYHVLHRFAATKTDGYYPYAGLTVDASGAAYGVTSAGGKYGTGTFFKLTPTKSGLWKETILYQFPNCANGCGPASTLVPDEAGNLYGSGAGGLHCGYDCGTVFKFTKQTNGTWKYNVVHKFNGKDGAFPFGVILDDKGNIFGTTFQGGKYGYGVAFEITP